MARSVLKNNKPAIINTRGVLSKVSIRILIEKNEIKSAVIIIKTEHFIIRIA